MLHLLYEVPKDHIEESLFVDPKPINVPIFFLRLLAVESSEEVFLRLLGFESQCPKLSRERRSHGDEKKEAEDELDEASHGRCCDDRRLEGPFL
uniref:Ovule protein n=1 Tax=Steinernema glaseri TaxID=37863 RepID=A0A1I7Z2X1_9BILA